MALDKIIKEIEEMTAVMEQRIALFESYIHENKLDADFERYCEEQKKQMAEQEKKRTEHPLKERYPII